MRKINILFIMFFVFSVLQSQTIAQWYTSMGNFQVMLREDLMPITSNNFIDLTNSEFYDGLIFHRVIDGFVIQDGDPTGTGSGGPGYTIPDEYHPEMLFNSAGVLGMAKTSQPNSAGSQYFITLGAASWLNGDYAAFGNVIEGIDIVQAIGDVPTDNNDKPITNVYIDSIRILTPQIDSFSPTETLITINSGESLMFVVFSSDTDIEYTWYVNDVLQTETTFIFNYQFSEEGQYSLKSITLKNGYTYTVEWVITVNLTAAHDSEVPFPVILKQNHPNPFTESYNRSGTTTIKFYVSDESQRTDLTIYNSKGERIKSLISDYLSAKEYNISWDGKDDSGKTVPAGVYFYQLKNGSYTSTRKMLFLK